MTGFTGGGPGGATRNTARLFIMLKPRRSRELGAEQVMGRLRGRLAHVSGAPTFLQAVQDLHVGARLGNAQYQYTLQGERVEELGPWARGSSSGSDRRRSSST